MAKHHIVQDKYLTQWRKSDTENQLNIYSIPDNKYIEKGPRWKGFWRKDFNVLDDDKNKFYLPENVTAIIDTRGIETIRKIDGNKQNQLSGEERSCVAFYVALQYIRTPRYREETDKFMEAAIKYFMKKDISSPEKISISKDEILKHSPKDKCEQEAIEKIKDMSDEEIKNQIFNSLYSNNLHICLTNTGHSKNILKIEKLAKGLFEVQWLFLIAPKDSAFVTSDNPCFTLSPTKIRTGLLSPNVVVFFPLRPDLCIAIKPSIKSQREYFLKLDKKKTKELNQLVLKNSYQFLIAKDKKQLENLTYNFNYKNHRKSRDVAISEFGNYVMFNVE
jgi:hypothetical protein